VSIKGGSQRRKGKACPVNSNLLLPNYIVEFFFFLLSLSPAFMAISCFFLITGGGTVGMVG